MNKKIIIGIVAAVVVIGGVVGTVLGVNAYQEKKAKEEQQRIEQEQAQAVNSLNDNINGIVNALNVPDAEGQNPSLDNNSDIDAINNAIASLQALDAEIDSNTTITEDQKKAIKGIIANYLASLNNRITVVNEEKAKAEAERQQAEAKKSEQPKTSSSSKKSGGNSNSGSAEKSGASNRDSELENLGWGSDISPEQAYYIKKYNIKNTGETAEQTHQRINQEFQQNPEAHRHASGTGW